MPFKPAIVTSDKQHVVVIAADKNNKDCIIAYNAISGTLVNRIALRSSGVKVREVVRLCRFKAMNRHERRS